jgi:hypothetical protein
VVRAEAAEAKLRAATVQVSAGAGGTVRENPRSPEDQAAYAGVSL